MRPYYIIKITNVLSARRGSSTFDHNLLLALTIGTFNALLCDLDNIANNNLDRDDAASMANAVELRVPYLDRELVELALRIAPELKIKNGIRKYILRLAAGRVLPDELVLKEKKAAQYSSGIYSAIEKLARNNGFKGEHVAGRFLEQIYIN
jgi:asparagine synthase (glutamine-hydrolysing)